MVTYKITFEFDIENSLEYDSDEQSVDISLLDDKCFDKVFDTKEKINEFQNWFNDGLSENEKIIINNISYDKNGYDEGILKVTLESELKDEKTFADEIVNYMFEGDTPRVQYQVTGTSYEDYWDYNRESPEQRTVNVDYEDYGYINSYKNVNINKL